MASALGKLVECGGQRGPAITNMQLLKSKSFCTPRGNMIGSHRYVNVGHLGSLGGGGQEGVSAR